MIRDHGGRFQFCSLRCWHLEPTVLDNKKYVELGRGCEINLIEELAARPANAAMRDLEISSKDPLFGETHLLLGPDHLANCPHGLDVGVG
jgi:hypothetical protein